jgi:hypothetical protein
MKLTNKFIKKASCYYIIIASFFLPTAAHSQINLIPDGSFEDTLVNWRNTNTDGALKDWFQLVPYTYINKWWLLSSYPLAHWGLPINGYVITYPKYGANAVNMVPYYDSSKYSNHCGAQSLVRSKLRDTLIAGKAYCATIWATASEQLCFFFTNGLGLYFDNGQLDTIQTKHYDTTGRYTFVSPQLQCPFVINDTANWMKIQGSFIANGTESYVTIGNFLTDSALLKVLEMTCGGTVGSYLQNILIDNVSLIPIDLKDWLQATYYPAGADSIWVGLPNLDYADGKWYDINMNYLSTGPGFWLKGPLEAGKQYIHAIDVCGTFIYDTTTLIQAPLGVQEYGGASANQFFIYPNPTTNNFYIYKNNNASNDVSVSIFDITGKCIHKQNLKLINGNALVNSPLIAGNYIVVIKYPLYQPHI